MKNIDMNLFKKLFRNKKASELVEKIMTTAFAVAAGAAVILFTANVIIESKNKNINGVLPDLTDTNRVIDESEGSDGLVYELEGDHYNVLRYEGSASSIVIPSFHSGLPVKKIKGGNVFSNSGAYPNVTSVVIGSGVTTLAEHSFAHCNQLTSVQLPNTITSIEMWSFNWCTSLSSINLPEGIENIGGGVFWCNYALTSVNLPSTLSSLAYDLFNRCTGLTTVTISKTSRMSYLGTRAFYGCTNLTSFHIPISVTGAASNVFQDCSSLTINFEATSLPSGFNSDFNPSNRPINWGIPA